MNFAPVARYGLAATALFALLGAAATPLGYPATPVRPVIDRYGATAVRDPYRWLENGDAPEVKRWARAQTAATLAYLQRQSSYAIYAKRVAELSKTSTNRFGLTIAGGQYVYLRQTPPQAQAALVVRDGIGGAERTLFDPLAAVKAGAPPAIGSVYVSNDGSNVAFTTQVGGDENETLHVVATATGTLLPDTIDHAGGGTSPVAVTWDADGKGFLHTKWPRNADGSFASARIEIFHHVLGTDPAGDTYVFGRDQTPKSEYTLETAPSGNARAISVTDGDGVHASIYLQSGTAAFANVATPGDGIGSSGKFGGHFVGDRLVVVSAKRDAHAELVAIDAGSTFAAAKTLLAPSAVTIDDFVPVDGGLITQDLDGGDSSARFVRTDGTVGANVPVPAQSTLTELAGDLTGKHDIVIGYVGYGTPQRWLAYNPATNAVASTGVERTVPGDYSKLIVRRAFVPSLDGTVKIPVEIVSLPNAKRDGTAPTILYAYGAYGIVTTPFFIGSTLAFLERGGVFAQAMIRGGGEYGEAWHTAAKLQTKTKSSDDLAAVATWMGTHGYGNAEHLGINGGSAGGFLMGLALTRNPERYRAVESDVGFYDLLREERTPNGAYNTPEFGSSAIPAQFAWMVKQSPYENVVRGRAYPAILMTTGENDPRVDPYNSRKMIARLQAASSSPYPILLLQKSGEGHGIGNSFEQRNAAATQRLTFFESQLR